jgi:multiple sugar transport system substrate-binding protein
MHVRRSVVRSVTKFVPIAFTLPLLLAACGGEDAVDLPDQADDDQSEVDDEQAESSAGQESVSISYLTHWPPEQVSALEAAIDRFNETEPGIDIEVRAVPFGNLLSTLRAQAASPAGPTITSIYDLWLPELVRDDIAAPIPDGDLAGVQDGWAANLLEAASVDGTMYGYPNEVNTYALNYRTDVFDAAGIDEPPADWDAMVQAAQDIVDSGAADQGIGLINSWPAGAVHPWLSLVASNDGTLVGDDGTPAIDSPEALAATELYQRLVDEGLTDPAMGTADATTAGPYLENFANGNTGMIIMANWWQSALRDAMGDDFDNVATAPVPVGPSGSTARGVSYSWLTVVNGNAGDAEQEAAWKFLSWLNGEGSGDNESSAMGDLLMSMGIIPSRTSDREAHADALDTPFLAPYVDGIADAYAFPIVLGGEELTNSVQERLENVMFGQLNAQDAAAEAQDDAESILERAAQ